MENKNKRPYYLVLTERDPDGQIMISHDMHREVIKARFKNEFITTIEVPDEHKFALMGLINKFEE